MDKVLVLLYPGFAEFEVTIATELLKDTHEIITIAASKAVLTAESGLQLLPHLAVSEVNPAEYAAIIIPGGTDLRELRPAETVRLVRTMYDQGKLVAAICGGPYVLALAGITHEKTYATTLYKEHRDFLGDFCEENVRQEAQLLEDGNVVTATGSAYAEFGLLVAEKLGLTISDRRARFFLGGHARLGTELGREISCTQPVN